MKKKRFIKLLMSFGMPRNDARTCAEWIVWDNLQVSKFNMYCKLYGSENRMDFRSYDEDFKAVDYKSLISDGGTV